MTTVDAPGLLLAPEGSLDGDTGVCSASSRMKMLPAMLGPSILAGPVLKWLALLAAAAALAGTAEFGVVGTGRNGAEQRGDANSNSASSTGDV